MIMRFMFFIKMATLLAILFSSLSNARILTFEVNEKERETFTAKEVCLFSLKKEAPLVEIGKDKTQVDCMSEMVSINAFCREKRKLDPFFARGFYDEVNSKIVCQSARKIILKYECESKLERFCEEATKGCLEMKERFAYELNIVHSGLSSSEEGNKVLICLFEAKTIREEFVFQF